MGEALRIERIVKGRLAPEQLQEELNYLLEVAWWFHLAALVALEAPADPAECFRRSRAKSSMLILRIEARKHFEMPALDLVDRLEERRSGASDARFPAAPGAVRTTLRIPSASWGEPSG